LWGKGKGSKRQKGREKEEGKILRETRGGKIDRRWETKKRETALEKYFKIMGKGIKGEKIA